MSLPIFDAEREAGLTDALGRSVAHVVAPVTVAEIDPKDEDVVSFLSNLKQQAAQAKLLDCIPDQPDLAKIDSILVSTGWNKNDDVFLPDQLYPSATSAAHKPINIGHEDVRIIGHMIKSRPVNFDGSPLVVAAGDAVPAEFEVEVAGVIYKALPTITDEVLELIEQAKAGRKSVSMEVLFTDFAYAFRKPGSDETKILARDKATAFLTKRLRAYGGVGEYEGYQVGRVLKNLTFSGMGIVDNPANPRSVIRQVAKVTTSYTKAELSQLTEGGAHSMPTNEELQNQVKTLNDSLATANASLAKANTDIDTLKSTVSAHETKAKENEAAIATLNTEASTAKATIESLTAEKESLAKQVADLTTRASTAEAAVAEAAKVAKAQTRLTKLQAVAKVEDPTAMLKQITDLDDAAFADLVLAEVAKNPVAAKASEQPKPEEKSEEKPATEQTAESTAAAEQTLSQATAEETPNLQAGNEGSQESEDGVARALAHVLLSRKQPE